MAHPGWLKKGLSNRDWTFSEVEKRLRNIRQGETERLEQGINGPAVSDCNSYGEADCVQSDTEECKRSSAR